MLEFDVMKRVAALIGKAIGLYLAASLALAVYVGLRAYLDAWPMPLALAALKAGYTLPLLAWTPTALVLYYSMNRVMRNRPLGYLLLLVCGAFLIAWPLALARFGLLSLDTEATEAFRGAGRSLSAWYISLTELAPAQAALAVVGVAWLLASAWGLTRLVGSRPLVGAFIAPGAVFGLWRLAEAYAGGALSPAFSFVGLNITPAMQAAALCGLTGLGFIGLDFLVAAKPGAEAGRG